MRPLVLVQRQFSSSADAAAAFTATLKTTNYVYTGSAIKVKASDITLVDTKTKADLSAYLVKDANGERPL